MIESTVPVHNVPLLCLAAAYIADSGLAGEPAVGTVWFIMFIGRAEMAGAETNYRNHGEQVSVPSALHLHEP